MNAKRLLTVCLLAGLVFTAVVYSAARRSKAKPGKQVIVKERLGRYLRGWATYEGGKVRLIDIEGKVFQFNKKDVKIFKVPELEAQFRKKQRDVKTEEDDRTAEYLPLLDWGMDRHLYEAVEKLADKLVRRNPANPAEQAIRAKVWAKEKLKLLKSRKGLRGDGFELTDEDVQKIKFALVPTDEPIKNLRVAFKQKVRKRFVDEMLAQGIFTKESAREFRRSRPPEQLRVMKEHSRDKFQEDVLIRNDPPAIVGFRRFVGPVLKRSCNTRACHGGDVSRLRLKSPMRTARQVYTNFIVLEKFPARAGWCMDHVNPEDSLIATYALPRDLVRTGQSHPTEIPPVFKSTEDKGYRDLMNYLKSLPVQTPDYGINLPEWPEPKPKVPTTTPATTRPAVKKRRR